MRNFLAICLFLAFCSAVMSPVYAGDTADCDEFKRTPEFFNPEYKGLYGLCVAYQNASEEDKEDIFNNWQKKVGDDGLPQLPNYPYPQDGECADEDEFCCPCWADLTVTQLCSLGSVRVSGTFIDDGYQGYVNFLDVEDAPEFPESTDSVGFYTMADNCSYVVQDADNNELDKSVRDADDPLIQIPAASMYEVSNCRAELEVIATISSDDCTP
jgi:hypothetical protein